MKLVLISAFVLLVGCKQPTSFKGDAHFPGGPSACYEMCKSNGMEMDSYIFVGEYSSGCVCRPIRTSGQASSQSASGSAASTAGVIAQTRIEEERRQAAARQQDKK